MDNKELEEVKSHYPLGSIVPDLECWDGGDLLVTGYGTLHSIYIAEFTCQKCGQYRDISDYDNLKQRVTEVE